MREARDGAGLRAVTFEVESVALPATDAVSEGWGASLQSLPDGSVVTSWYEGKASGRLARIELTSGDATVIPTRWGMVRDSVTTERMDLSWLVCEYAFIEIEVDPFKIRRVLTKGVGNYQHAAVRVSDDHVLLTQRYGRNSTIVSLSRMEVDGRTAIAWPDLAIPEHHQVMSFATGARYRFDENGRRAGRPRELPVGVTPLRDQASVVYLEAKLEQPTQPELLDDTQRYSSAVSTGVVMTLDMATFAARPVGDFSHHHFRALHGCDDEGRLLAANSYYGHIGRTVTLTNRERDGVEATHTFLAPIIGVVRTGPRSAAVRHGISHVDSQISLIKW